ncbi:MAG: aldehyde dehydrogenase family protein, partial [Pseudomonadales bacterium]|nr:aldehyde dehydrogenase family protein [Pseudomonadales bacterium]
RTLDIIHAVLKKHNVSTDLVQTPNLPANRKVTSAIMKHDGIAFILATGGPSMVKSAYQSGTPAIGVGKGNAPVWICKDANIENAVQCVVNSKAFDNGIVCGSENNLLVDQSIRHEFIDLAIQTGSAYLNEDEIQRLLITLFTPHGKLQEHWVGQTAEKICTAAQITRDYPIKVILAPVVAFDLHSPLLREKLIPVLSIMFTESDDQALTWAKQILSTEGEGHTAIIHSESRKNVRAFSQAVTVSRVIVNTPGTLGCIGAANGLQLSWTLGCGTFGGSSTSDNVTYTHLQNTKRIALHSIA